MFSTDLNNRFDLVRNQGVGGSNPLSPTIHFFGPIEDQIKGLSVCRIKTYGINRAVQKYISQQFGLFRRFPHKVEKTRIFREF